MMTYVPCLAGDHCRARVLAVIVAMALMSATTTRGDDPPPSRLEVLRMKINVYDVKLLNALKWPVTATTRGSRACGAYVVGQTKTGAAVMLVPNHLGYTEVTITTPEHVFVYGIEVVQGESDKPQDKPQDDKHLPEIMPVSEDLAVGESATFEFPNDQINTLCTQRQVCRFELDGLEGGTARALRVRRVSADNRAEFAAVVWQKSNVHLALYKFGLRKTPADSK
jgi:hypothetical protein